MPRAKLAADGDTEYWYFTPKFKTKEDCEAAKAILDGLTENTLVVYQKMMMRHHLTIVGQTILEVFKVPNRSYDLEDVQALLEERHFSPSTAVSYLPEMCRAGLIYKVGPRTYAKRHKPDDPATAIRATVELEAPSDGNIARLEHSETGGCGCGDEGHTS